MTIKGLMAIGLPWVAGLSIAYAQIDKTMISLPTIEQSVLRQATQLEPTNPQQEITFTVWIKLRNKAQLTKWVNDLYDPQSQHYQQFLTQEQFDEQYAPSPKIVTQIEKYFAQHHMKTQRVYSNIKVTGTVNQIEKLFKVKINNYSYRQKKFYGNASAPLIETKIAPYVLGVSGLSNIPYAHPYFHKQRQAKNKFNINPPQPLNFLWNSFVPSALPTTQSLNGFTGEQLRIAYNLANIAPINGTPIDGTGQTIVIIDGCGHSMPDEILTHANHYNTVNNLPLLNNSNFAVVKHTGEPYTGVCPNPDGWDGEILLDIEASHTIAPGANIVLVLTNDVDNAEVAEALNYIVQNQFTIAGFPNAYVVSNSWDNTYENLVELLEPTLLFSSAFGLSVNFAAGDCGDQTYNSSWTCQQLSNTPSVQYPVSSAYVTAVGGTSLFVDNNWNYAFETGWGTLVNGAFYSGSMGGISQYRPAPSWQQSTISNFIAGGYPLGTVGYYNKRALPDIAMLADLYNGLLTYSPGCEPCFDGGASLATPLFSGTLTLVNQARALLSGGTQNPIGLAAPYFYLNNHLLLKTQALNLITPPHQIINGAEPVNGGPSSAFQIFDTIFTNPGQYVTFNWDSSLTIIESQFWNDVVGVGSPNIPNFVSTMAIL